MSTMATNDIYDSQRQYLSICEKINKGTILKPDAKSKYYLKNPANLQYFKRLIQELEVKDISYIRRIQVMKALRKTAHYTKKDFRDLNRDDVKEILLQTNKAHKTTSTRRDFLNYNKQIWKMLFPELDTQGRPDDTITPYAWRIKLHIDKSQQKDKSDKLTDTEYYSIQRSLSHDPRTQLFLSMMYCNLARPQELCFINLENVEVFENYARVRISEHGKEGTKTLQLIDNYYYLMQWLNKHPYWPDDKTKPLFVTMSNASISERLTPKAINKILRSTLKILGINKPVTNYSFKRNGVTSRLLSGEAGQNIQKIAGWTSTDQIKTYDLSQQEEYLRKELVEKGILKDETGGIKAVNYKLCSFCNTINAVTSVSCGKCQRPLDRDAIRKAEAEKEQQFKTMEQELRAKNQELNDKLEALQNSFVDIKKLFMERANDKNVLRKPRRWRS